MVKGLGRLEQGGKTRLQTRKIFFDLMGLHDLLGLIWITIKHYSKSDKQLVHKGVELSLMFICGTDLAVERGEIFLSSISYLQ